MKDFSKNQISILISLSLFKTEELVKQPLGYFLKISYFDGAKNEINPDEVKIIDEYFKKYTKTGTKTFQRSASGNWFKYFSVKNYQFNGSVPFGTAPFTYKLTFDIHQKGF